MCATVVRYLRESHERKQASMTDGVPQALGAVVYDDEHVSGGLLVMLTVHPLCTLVSDMTTSLPFILTPY